MAGFKSLVSSLLLVSLALPTFAAVTDKDFTGIGRIYVLKSEDWRKATPKDQVGCISDTGAFISPKDKDACGVFAHEPDYPYTLSSRVGNCTFADEKKEKNTDSHYGKNDNAWSCNAGYKADVYDSLYTINGFPYPFLCFGDIACYYDAKRIPSASEKVSLWQFRWGSQQLGITPGHVMLQLLWDKIGELPKRGGETRIPTARVEVSEGMQDILAGEKMQEL